jgi:hypothetical protein
VISVLQMPLRLRHLLRGGAAIAKAFRENRPHRPRQMQQLNELLDA